MADSTTYRDKRGHTWDVSLTLAGARRIDQANFSEIWDHPFSILNPDEKVWPKLQSDRSLMMAMIYANIQPQIYKHEHYDAFITKAIAKQKERELPPISAMGISELVQEEWGSAHNGDIITEACDAFWEALEDFFPGQRTSIHKFREMQTRAMRIVNENMVEMLEESWPLVENDIRESAKAFMQRERKNFHTKLGLDSSKSEPSLDGPETSGKT